MLSTGNTCENVLPCTDLLLRQKPGAQRVLVIDAPASVALHAIRGVGAICLLRDAIEQQIAQPVGRETQRAVARIGGDLHVDVVHMLLQAK